MSSALRLISATVSIKCHKVHQTQMLLLHHQAHIFHSLNLKVTSLLSLNLNMCFLLLLLLYEHAELEGVNFH